MDFPYANIVEFDNSGFIKTNDFQGGALIRQPVGQESPWGARAKATSKRGHLSRQARYACSDECGNNVYSSLEMGLGPAMVSPNAAAIPSPSFFAMPSPDKPRNAELPYVDMLPRRRAQVPVPDAMPFMDAVKGYGQPYNASGQPYKKLEKEPYEEVGGGRQPDAKPGGGYGCYNPGDVCECGTAFILNFGFCANCGRQRPNIPSVPKRAPAAATAAFNDVNKSLGTFPPGILHPESAPEPLQKPTEITTLMVCDIPCTRTIEQVAAAMDSAGFGKTYDLIYMPKSTKQRGRRAVAQVRNIGYAFVNFKKPEFAAMFMIAFHDFRWAGTSTTKLSYAKPAHFQGFEANFEMQLRSVTPGPILTFRDEISNGQILCL